MKPTDFSRYLTYFLTNYLPHEKGVSSNTISSYKNTFVLYITFMKEKGIKVDNLTFQQMTKDSVVCFLDWIQTERKCTNSTRNARLSAIHSFMRYLQYQLPENLYECQKILSIQLKKSPITSINYLSIDGITCLLQQPDMTTVRGRRDLALLSLMYDTGARVQEIIDLTPSCLHLDKPTTIKITGKGQKTRIVPLLDNQVRLLKSYLIEHRLMESHASSNPIFFNSRSEKLTRAGVNHILFKYTSNARRTHKMLMPEKISCHSLRHSKAMHLLQAGVNLVYIRDILGHVSVQTTEVYARADSKLKREALEKAYVDTSPRKTPVWLENEGLLKWLKSL